MEVTDEKLYENIKKKVYADIPQHSAYRSGILVQKYKEAFKKKYKNTRKKPYKGNRTKKKGLRRWFDEEWVNQRGEVGYKYKNDVYRPKIRITDDTPITHDELTKKEIEKARVKKYRKGRIDRFRTGGKVIPPPSILYINPDDETPPQYQEEDVGVTFTDEINDEFDEFDDFDEYLRHYKIVVKECFDKHIEDINSLTYHKDLNVHKTTLIYLHSEAIDGDIYNFCDDCDDFPDMDFTRNRNFVINLENLDKDIIIDAINRDIIDHIHRYIDELGQNIDININNLIQEIDKFENEDSYLFNREIFPEMNELNYLKIDCVCLLKMTMTEIMEQYFYPPDEWDDYLPEPDYYVGGKKSKKNKTRKIKIKFKDYPDFRPNLTPREMFVLGSFGGTYWRPIDSGVTGKSHKNEHLKYPKSWWKGIPEEHLTSDTCDVSINKYKVNVGTSLEFWESKNWINKLHPYGWVQWYCDFYQGKRCPDDERQIQRWKNLAGPNGRFMRFLVTQIIKKGAKWNDETISPKIRQVLQHWGYKLTNADYNNEIKRRSV
tara:strand:+ start:3929 stop:5563 length:1635 start_codon:yes stop_codon:yes gene_type:complete